MKKVLVVSLVTLLVGFIGFYIYCRNFAYNENYLQLAKDATAPNMNFLFARNASLVGRVYMTFSGKEFKPCINTATAFFNNFDTCSNCEDFVKNPARWRFQKVDVPQVGDIIVQHNSNPPSTAPDATGQKGTRAVTVTRAPGPQSSVNSSHCVSQG